MTSTPESAKKTDEFRFALAHIKAADIVFVYPSSAHLHEKIIRFFNIVGQRFLAGIRREHRVAPLARVPRFTHVMLGVGSGLVVHADGKIVRVEIVSDALAYATDRESTYEIYRMRDLTDERGNGIAAAATRYYNQRYSFLAYFRSAPSTQVGSDIGREDTTQFCSRLVAHAYRSAGFPFSARPDSRMLPLDLYQICQSEPWTDITSEFVQAPVPPDMDRALGEINLPDGHGVGVNELFRRMDEAVRRNAELTAERYDVQYTVTRELLQVEASLAKLVTSQFDLARLLRIAPDKVDDAIAARIVRVLEQLDTLVAMSRVPSLELFTRTSLINVGDESLYAGHPPPSAIREMQLAREAVTVYSYLHFAEIGLLSALAHFTAYEKLDRFRTVKREYAEQFLAAAEPIAAPSKYADDRTLFLWVDDDAERAGWRTILRNIIQAAEGVILLRRNR